MNISEQEAYNEGLEAQNNGASLDSNPYAPATHQRQAWDLGWFQGSDEDYEEDMLRG